MKNKSLQMTYFRALFVFLFEINISMLGNNLIVIVKVEVLNLTKKTHS